VGRGIIHRKVQHNRARDMGSPDHQRAGVNHSAFASIHRDNPDAVAEMMRPPPVPPVDENPTVTLRQSDLQALLARVAALESAAVVPAAAQTSQQHTEHS
jgi:hypothetical protein